MMVLGTLWICNWIMAAISALSSSEGLLSCIL